VNTPGVFVAVKARACSFQIHFSLWKFGQVVSKHNFLLKICSVENMPKPYIVILSEAKNLRQNGRSFTSLRMTAVGFQQSINNP
jgi:hypothetical protein